ncbi:MAG: sigma 54-interacting transcriptional regulator, partial [Gammaproteobacteria bacterium]
YRRVGSVETRQANFRLIAATHKPLREMVARGEFRQDLYYRLSAFPIHLPALRERREDLPLLVATFLGQADARAPRCSLAPAALARLEQHDWPGNIRELRNVLERARLYADDGVIRPEHLPDYLGLAAQTGGGVPLAASTIAPDDGALRALVGEFRGTRRELATRLGMSERTLYRRLKALGLS